MVEAPRLTVDELRKRMDGGEKFVFIDVRNAKAWAESEVKIPGAIRVPLDDVDANLSKIPTGRPIVTYCT